MEIVFWSVTAALAALGLIELVRMLVFWLTRPLCPGAITLVPLLDMALALYREMSSFQEFNMDAYVPLT